MKTSVSNTGEPADVIEYTFKAGQWELINTLPVYYYGEEYNDWMDKAGILVMCLRDENITCETISGATFYITIFTARHGWLARCTFFGQSATTYVVIPTFPDYLLFKKELDWMPIEAEETEETE